MPLATDHIYIHVPFCDGKCGYCAFYSIPYSAAAADRWVDAILGEMRGRLPVSRPAPKTIYIGGGTPSVLARDQFAKLAAGFRAMLSFARLREWTVEVNPGSLTPALLRSLLEAGVNRFSVGAQALDDSTLRILGRRHGASDIRRTVRILKSAGIRNFGLDLISGIPGVDATTWSRTLAETVSMRPAHLSVYSLTLEPGTPLAGQAAAGVVRPADDSLHLDLLAEAERILGSAGCRRYEISNYALPGMACRHNLACWRGDDYLGFGPAASSRAHRTRRTNKPDLSQYLSAAEAGQDAPADAEELDSRTDLSERFMFTFRLAGGVSVDTFCRRFGPVPPALRRRWERGLRRMENAGLLRCRSGRWQTTRRGRDMADTVASEFID